MKKGALIFFVLLAVSCKKIKQEGVYAGTYTQENYEIGELQSDTTYTKSLSLQRNGERFEIDNRQFDETMYNVDIISDDHHRYTSIGDEEAYTVIIVGDSLYYNTHVQSLGFKTITTFAGVKE